jgi:hypothetical protein
MGSTSSYSSGSRNTRKWVAGEISQADVAAGREAECETSIKWGKRSGKRTGKTLFMKKGGGSSSGIQGLRSTKRYYSKSIN